MKLACSLPRLIRSLIAAVSLSVVVVSAEQTGFTSTLSEENKSAIGLARLSGEQLTSLNAQIQREISVARQGKTVAFSSTFTRRRTPQQRKDAGLDRLMTPELSRLDTLVAAAIATEPVSTTTSIDRPVSTPPAANWVEITPRKIEVHGEVSLTYMRTSGGGSGYGASVVTTATDPSGKFSLTVGLSQFHGKGLGYRCPCNAYPCDHGW